VATRRALCLLCLLCLLLALQAPVHAQLPPPAPTVAVAVGVGEPSAREVVRMALDAARRLGPARIRALARRARLAGLVPQLRLSAERGVQQDLTHSSSTQAARVNAATGDDVSVGATLTFDFDRLVYAPEETRLLSVERWLVTDQRKLVADVIKLYFERRRLLREQAGAAQKDPELADSISEAEALLDGYTDGKFSASLPSQRGARKDRAR
jgi:hypothetical protein